jgi:two-component system, OmpR family, sensor kinase
MIKHRFEVFHNYLSPRSLRYQLLTRMLLILSSILLLIGILQFFVMKDFLYRNEAELLRNRMMSLPKTILFGPEMELSGQSNHSRLLFADHISLAHIETNGEFTDLSLDNGLIAPRLSADVYSSLVDKSSKREEMGYQVAENSEGIKQLIVFRRIGGGPGLYENTPAGFLQIGTNIDRLGKILMKQFVTFIILSALALAAGIAVYFSAIRKSLLPLSTIVDAVENINAGNLSKRIPMEHGQDEIDRLSHSFNDMLERLDTSFRHERETKEQMRQFIADASHELRTPLTSIHGFVEVLLRGAANRPEQLYKALNSMHGESKRIIKLVEDLLLLAKLDRAPDLHVSSCNLTNLLEEMRPQLDMLAGDRTLTFIIEENICGYYDSDKIKQIILNLYHNAVQHTDSNNGKIEIALHVKNDCAVIKVKDDGPGIDQENLPHIFDRFYRLDSSRARANGGAGLGLAITKSIVEAHGGKIIAESNKNKGSIFTVYLPLIK